MKVFTKFWLGQIPLHETFWLGWALPVVGGNVLASLAAIQLISHWGLSFYFGLIAVLFSYGIAAVIPVWRSASTYRGARSLSFCARAIAALAAGVQIFAAATMIYSLASLDSLEENDRTAEKTAVASKSHPMAGFWKSNATDDFGLAIAPAGAEVYSVSFCGPGGCFKPGTYRPNSPIVGDAQYQVVSTDTLRVLGQNGWTTYNRAAGRGEDNCRKK